MQGNPKNRNTACSINHEHFFFPQLFPIITRDEEDKISNAKENKNIKKATNENYTSQGATPYPLGN